MKRRAFLYIILTGMLWGTSGIFVHYLSPFGYTASQMASIRGFVSSVVLAIYVFICKRELFKVNFKEIISFALGGASIYFVGSCYYAAIQETSVSTAVTLMYIAPVIVMAYSVAFLGEKFNFTKLVSVIFMIVGCGLVSGIIGGLKFSVIGIILGICSGIAYSTYNIATKIQMRKGYNPLKSSMYGFFFMTLISFLISNPIDIVKIANSNPLSIPLLIGCGVCTSILPYCLYAIALKTLPVGTASSLSVVEPMSATVFSVIFLREILNIYTTIGIILILCAVFMLGKNKD